MWKSFSCKKRGLIVCSLQKFGRTQRANFVLDLISISEKKVNHCSYEENPRFSLNILWILAHYFQLMTKFAELKSFVWHSFDSHPFGWWLRCVNDAWAACQIRDFSRACVIFYLSLSFRCFQIDITTLISSDFDSSINMMSFRNFSCLCFSLSERSWTLVA